MKHKRSYRHRATQPRASCKNTPRLVKAMVGGPTTVGTKTALLGHLMSCINCTDLFKEALESRNQRDVERN